MGYHTLNKVTVLDKFAIPNIDELFDKLAGIIIFSKLDLKFGYPLIQIREEDIEKTNFRTHDKYYEFLVMPFGHSNALATFQRVMNKIFRPYLKRFILIFLRIF